MSVMLAKWGLIFGNIPGPERRKVVLLTLSLFCLVGCYTIIRELRDALFISLVGIDYIQYAQIISMIVLVPALLYYAYLVDHVRKDRLVCGYTLLYGIGFLVIALLLGNDSIGLIDSCARKDRLFGWLIYIFLEGYAPFVLSLFFAFVNSITSPESASQSYGIIVAGSKVGGMLVAAIAWWFCRGVMSSDVVTSQYLMLFAAAMVLVVPLCIMAIVRDVPERFLHGYDAAYRADKQDMHTTQSSWYGGLIAGIRMLTKYPYVVGMFGLVFFWEVTSVFLNYQRLSLGALWYKTTSSLSEFLFLQCFLIHAFGFILSLVGSRYFLNYFGQRISLMAIPAVTGILLIIYCQSISYLVTLLAFVLIRALNHSFAISVREALYIPTTKTIRFKSKSWIDAFGAKFARSTGSAMSLLIQTIFAGNILFSYGVCFILIVSWWSTAYAVGRRYESAIENNEVIGLE